MTADPGTPLDSVRAMLRGYPPALLQEFEAASVHVERRLAGDALRTWAEQGLDVARESLRSWEAAAEYYRASPAVLDEIGFPRFTEWGRIGADLAAESPALGGAYFRASPRALEHLSIAQAGDWSAQGRGLYKGTWKSSSLAAQYFEVSPDLLPLLPLGQLRLLVELVDALSGHSYELASSCLAMAPRMLADLVRADRAPFLEFGIVVAGTAWADARVYFERGPGLLERLAAPQRARYLTLASRVALRVGRHGHPYFLEAAQALAAVQPEVHQDLIDLAEELVEDSAPSAMEFLKSSPAVLERLYPEDLPRWQAAGRAILHASEDGGVAFFRLESAKAEEVIDALTSRLELTRIGELLRLYCKALTGADVAVHPAETLTEKGVGWVSESSPTTEGSAIYLPARVEQYDTKAENFAVYKVYATHQAARLEFGSFRFEFDRPSALFEDQRAARAGRPAGKALTDMERFFDLFEDRRLAHDLFTILEDTRIDAAVKREYAGIRRAFNRLQQDAADRRPDVEQMPARQAMVENLLRASLDEAAALRWPPALARLIAEPLRILQRVRVDGASVEDATEGVIRLYDWLARIPNVELEELAWERRRRAGRRRPRRGPPSPYPPAAPGRRNPSPPPSPPASRNPTRAPPPWNFAASSSPELVQLLMRMRSQDQPSDDAPLAPLSPEQLQQLLEKSVEITLTDLTEGDLSETSGLFMENLMKELAEVAQQGAKGGQDTDDGPSSGEEDAAALGEMEASFYYDEWDFRANDYKPRWCRVREQRLATGDSDFYDRTLADYAVPGPADPPTVRDAAPRTVPQDQAPPRRRRLRPGRRGRLVRLHGPRALPSGLQGLLPPQQGGAGRRRRLPPGHVRQHRRGDPQTTPPLRRRRPVRGRPPQISHLVGAAARAGGPAPRQADHRPRERSHRAPDRGAGSDRRPLRRLRLQRLRARQRRVLHREGPRRALWRSGQAAHRQDLTHSAPPAWDPPSATASTNSARCRRKCASLCCSPTAAPRTTATAGTGPRRNTLSTTPSGR